MRDNTDNFYNDKTENRRIVNEILAVIASRNIHQPYFDRIAKILEEAAGLTNDDR